MGEENQMSQSEKFQVGQFWIDNTTKNARWVADVIKGTVTFYTMKECTYNPENVPCALVKPQTVSDDDMQEWCKNATLVNTKPIEAIRG